VAEHLGLEEFVRQRRAVHSAELGIPARTLSVEPTRHHVLPAACFAFDQDRKRTGGLLGHHRPEFSDLATVPYQTTRMLDRLNHLTIKDQMDRRRTHEGGHSEQTVDTGTASRDRRAGPAPDKARERLIPVSNANRTTT
jgi:hypothetical protein